MSRSRQPLPPVPKWHEQEAADSDGEEGAALDPPVDDDALMASLAGFLVPDPMAPGGDAPWGASQLQMTQEEPEEADDDERSGTDEAAGAHPPAADARHPPGTVPAIPAVPAKQKQKRTRKRKGETQSEEPVDPAAASAQRALEAAAAEENDREAAAHRLAQHKARQKRRRIDTSGNMQEESRTRMEGSGIGSYLRLRHIASTGLVHSSLPLLSALVRERLLEHSLPPAAQALQQLYPAYRLDMDSIFKCSIQLLEAHTRAAMGSRTGQGETAAMNQLTRFYRKIINLQPKNMLQVVFELAFQFLRHGQSQEAYDHLSTWVASPFLAASAKANVGPGAGAAASDAGSHAKGDASAVPGGPLQLMQGYLGVIAWECAKQAQEEGARLSEALQRREDGDDESDSDMHHRRQYHSSRGTSLQELRLEIRTCQQKATSFEKLARSKLRSAVNADRGNVVWLWYYLECMQDFYARTMQHGVGHGHNTSASAAARVHLDQSKLLQLQQRLLRKIDDFIAAHDGAEATGFHMRLHYMHLFQPEGPQGAMERAQHWLLVRHLLAKDPVSNLALAHAWHLWVAQGERDRPTGGFGRAADLMDAVAARLDVYPEEEWSWHALTRLLAAETHVEPQCALWRWPLADPLEPHKHTPVTAAAAPAAPDSAPSSPLRVGLSAAARDTDSESDFGGSSLSGHSTPVRSTRALRAKREQQGAAAAAAVPAYEDDGADESTGTRTPQYGAQPGVPASPLSQSSGDTGTSSQGHRFYAHLQSDSLPLVSDHDRQQGTWLGRIEWWVQAPSHWRDVPHVQPAEVPDILPNGQAQRMLLLRGLCYNLVLRWMGWIQ